MDECIDHHCEILSSQCRAEVSVGGAATATVSAIRLPSADAFLLCPVVVGRARVASSHAGLSESITNGVGAPVLFDIQWPIDTAVLVRSALPVFEALEVWKHIVKGPTWQSTARPTIIVATMAADVCHSIDGRGATDNLATGALDTAIVQCCVKFREIHPVIHALEQNARPSKWNTYPRIPIPTACFDNGNLDVWVFGKTAGEYTTSRASTDNDVVKLQLRPLFHWSVSLQRGAGLERVWPLRL